ncbi:site-specific recombinase, phage integrase family, partial [Ostertagia ostertagi]
VPNGRHGPKLFRQPEAQAGRQLAQIIVDQLTSHWLPGTIAAYSSMRKRFQDFATTLKIDKSHLGKIRNLFLAHLINENQLKALPMAVAALNFFYGHLERGEADLQKLLIDSAKKQTPAVRHKEKATDEDIDRVVNWALNIDTPKTIEDSCIILLSFIAFLRISETAAVRKEHLERKSTEVWWLLIPKSKTDQIKRGTTVAFRVQGNRAVLWNKFMDRFLFDAIPRQPLLKSDSLRRRIKDVLRSCGLHDRGLTSHSFRGGAATAAMRRGVKYEDIKRVGRWKSSNSMMYYLEPTPI